MAISKEHHLRKGSDSWPHALILAYLVGFGLLIPFTLGPEGRLQIGSNVNVPRPSIRDVKKVDLQLEDMRGWAQLSREVRFPSPEQRLKIYLGNWYETCGPKFRFQRLNETMMLVEEHSGRLLEVFSRPETDGLFWLEPKVLAHCSESTWVLSIYCRDSANLTRARRPVLMQYGDAVDPKGFGQVDVPIVKKSRPRLDYFGGCPSLERKEAVLWRLNSERHFGKLPLVSDKDVPWEKKKAVAVFRGALTGITQDGLSQANGDYNNCMISRRCRLVYTNDKSPLVDAKLTGYKNVENIISSKINGIDIFGDSISIPGHLQYKALIMMEGNDVSSGLKWALYSNSVVLMPRPHHTTWAMEELLEEWVHYIPLDEDLGNLQTQMEWVVANDEKANAIAQRGKAWIHDLVFSEHANEESDWVDDQIMIHLANHFEETGELANQFWSEDTAAGEDQAEGLDADVPKRGSDLSMNGGKADGIAPALESVGKLSHAVEAAPQKVPSVINTPGASPAAASTTANTESENLPKKRMLVGEPAAPRVHGPEATSAGIGVAIATPGPTSASGQAVPNGEIASRKDSSGEANANADKGSKEGSGVESGPKHGPLVGAEGPQYVETDFEGGKKKGPEEESSDEGQRGPFDGETEKDVMSWSSVEGKDKK